MQFGAFHKRPWYKIFSYKDGTFIYLLYFIFNTTIMLYGFLIALSNDVFLRVNGCSMTTRPQFSSVEGASGENKCGKTVVHGM